MMKKETVKETKLHFNIRKEWILLCCDDVLLAKKNFVIEHRMKLGSFKSIVKKKKKMFWYVRKSSVKITV